MDHSGLDAAPNRQNRRYLIFLVILSLWIIISFQLVQSESSENLQVSFIDVGQGDSALLRDSSGFDVLIDGGTVSSGTVVTSFLRSQEVDDIDILVATHPDADHIGGLIAVLQMDDIPVRKVVLSGYPGSTQTWQNFLSAITAEGLTPEPVRFPGVFQWGQMTVYVLNPPNGLNNPDTNQASLVLRIDFGANKMLFTGDIDETVEARVLARSTPVAAQVLKVAHHGSQYSTSSGFLSAVNPDQGVISVGRNSYGHPAPETIQRLRSAGARVWRTDFYGTVSMSSDGIQWSVISEKTPQVVFLPWIGR